MNKKTPHVNVAKLAAPTVSLYFKKKPFISKEWINMENLEISEL